MGNAFFVVWRESLEALLVAGILFAWLQINDPSGKGRRALIGGLAAGVALAAVLAWALITVQDGLSGNALEVFQTAALLVAAGLITQMVLWMHHHGRELRSRLHGELTRAQQRAGTLGVAAVAALAVAREGAETVIFLYGMAQGGAAQGLALGALGGFAAAVLTAVIAAKSLARLKLTLLLRVSALLLLVLASSLLVAAVDRMIGADWLPALLDPVWDASPLLDDASTTGKVFADLSGYRARPALTTLLAWAGYWLLVVYAWRRAR